MTEKEEAIMNTQLQVLTSTVTGFIDAHAKTQEVIFAKLDSATKQRDRIEKQVFKTNGRVNTQEVHIKNHAESLGILMADNRIALGLRGKWGVIAAIALTAVAAVITMWVTNR